MAKLAKVVKDKGGKVAATIFTAPLSMIEVIEEEDTRDRTTQRYLEHFEIIKAGIVAHGGIQDMLTGYRGKGDEEDTIFLTNGRTRFFAALEAIEEGLLGEDLLVEVKIRQGSAIDHLATQLRAQNSLDFTVTEKTNLVLRALNLAADNVDIVCERLNLKKQEVQRYIDFDCLPVPVKELVNQGTVKLTVALDVAKDHNDEELLDILTTATAIKEEINSNNKPKGKGHKPNQLTRADLYLAELEANGDVEEVTSQQRQTINDGITLEGFHPHVLLKIDKLVQGEIKRLTTHNGDGDEKTN